MQKIWYSIISSYDIIAQFYIFYAKKNVDEVIYIKKLVDKKTLKNLGRRCVKLLDTCDIVQIHQIFKFTA